MSRAYPAPERCPTRSLVWRGPPRRQPLFLFLIALVDWYYVMYMILFTGLYAGYLVGRAWVQGGRDAGRYAGHWSRWGCWR